MWGRGKNSSSETWCEPSEETLRLVFHCSLPSRKCFGKIEQSADLLLLLYWGADVKASEIWLPEGSELFLLPRAAGEMWLQLTPSLGPTSNEAECKFLACVHSTLCEHGWPQTDRHREKGIAFADTCITTSSVTSQTTSKLLLVRERPAIHVSGR